MKNQSVTSARTHVALIVLAAVAPLAVLIPVGQLPVVAVVGALAVAALLLFALGDYARRPAFRVRRALPPQPAREPFAAPLAPAYDWTYAPRSA